jgi:hypothetical protein
MLRALNETVSFQVMSFLKIIAVKLERAYVTFQILHEALICYDENDSFATFPIIRHKQRASVFILQQKRDKTCNLLN